MAKKSARSKGYRKYHKETKGYTPQEKKVMIIGFAVIAVILICVLWLPDFIESFHLLNVKDGVVQDVGDNWLIANVGTSSNKKYRKMAEFDGIEGYELASVEEGITDSNLRYFVYEPTTDDAPAQKVNVQPGNGDAETLAESFLAQMSAFGEVLNQSEAVEIGEVNGVKTYTVVMEYRSENYSEAIAEAEAEAEGEEAAEETTEETEEEAEEEIVYDYNQNVIVYVDSNLDGKCIVLNAMNTGADETCFQDTAAMAELLYSAVPSLTLAN